MRIALVSLHFAEYATRLALALATDNPVLLVLRRDNAERELNAELHERLRSTPNIQLLMITHRPARDPRMLVEAVRLFLTVRAFHPEVVHCQEYLADYCVFPMLALWRIYPGVLTMHDVVKHSGQDSRLIARARHYQRWLRCRTDRYIVHGERIKGEVTKAECAAIPADAIPHGILGTTSSPFPLEDAEPLTLLFFGRVEAYKGLDDLLSACETLVERGVFVRLIIAGRGTELETQRQRIANSPWIELQEGFIPTEAIPSLFRRAALVVLPYRDATQSGVAAMAFAFGRPVLATDTGALPEVVIPDQTGMLVPPNSPELLADAIEELLADKQRLEKLAVGAAKFATSTLAWPRIAEQTLAVYSAAVEQRQNGTKK